MELLDFAIIGRKSVQCFTGWVLDRCIVTAMKIDFSKWLALLLQDFKLISNQPKLISKTKKMPNQSTIKQYSQPQQIQ